MIYVCVCVPAVRHDKDCMKLGCTLSGFRSKPWDGMHPVNSAVSSVTSPPSSNKYILVTEHSYGKSPCFIGDSSMGHHGYVRLEGNPTTVMVMFM